VKFILVDQILELDPGKRIVARKAVSMAEEYLADHFPKFPVLPGVLMIEAMVQTAAWLVRDALEFAPTLVLLKEARNVTYKSFVAPGQVLQLEAQCLELTPAQSRFDARGVCDGREIVKGRLTLRHLRLTDTDAAYAETDAQMRVQQRALFGLLWRGRPAGVPAGMTLDA
jgi:3-hydroxyacyl-[acyl-carrier-protein] dehydratase